jgi:hypothetical protein
MDGKDFLFWENFTQTCSFPHIPEALRMAWCPLSCLFPKLIHQQPMALGGTDAFVKPFTSSRPRSLPSGLAFGVMEPTASSLYLDTPPPLPPPLGPPVH